MRALFPLIIYISVFLGLTLGIYLLFLKSEKNKANSFLGLLLLFFTFYLVPGMFDLLGLLSEFPHLIQTGRLFNLMAGPLAYFYVLSNIEDEFHFRQKDWLHFLPSLLLFFVNIPFFTQSGEDKLVYFNNPAIRNADTSYHIQAILNGLSFLIYLPLAIKTILKYRTYQYDNTSSIDNIYHRWLVLFCFLLLIPSVVVVLYPFGLIPPIIIISSFGLFTIGIQFTFLFKPMLFHKYPHQLPTLATITHEQKKYTSSFQTAQKDRYLSRLLRKMEEDKPYLIPELTLNQLAKQIKISPRELSRIINEEKETNFLDFINGYRVAEIKDMLGDEKYNHLTFLSIAFEAGFNSKTAFYTSFKKQTGMTPTKYRKSMSAEIKKSA